MSVIIETTLGDITVDLYTERRPRCCINFLKLSKLKYYNYNLFHTVRQGFIAQTGDHTGAGNEGRSVWGVLEGEEKKYFQSENNPRIKHAGPGLLSFVGDINGMIGSQFFLTLGDELGYLDAQHCVFGEVVEGFDLLHKLNDVICDEDARPYKDIRITHTVVLCDPYEDPPGLIDLPCSPPPTTERLQNGRIAADEDTDDEANLTTTELAERRAEREAKARATILEMIGDIPDSEVAPPENVLFVCKLNPVTTDQDLEIIFSRFGKIKSCEVIRDKKTGDSLQYAFIEFEEKSSCENAYFKMGNVLIDDRRIHVDFSQSVAKIQWFGKGRIKYENESAKQDFGTGKYQKNNSENNKSKFENNKRKDSFEKPKSKDYENREERRFDKERDYSRNKQNERDRYNKSDDKYKRNDRKDDRRDNRNVDRSRYEKFERYEDRNKRREYEDRNNRREYEDKNNRRDYGYRNTGRDYYEDRNKTRDYNYRNKRRDYQSENRSRNYKEDSYREVDRKYEKSSRDKVDDRKEKYSNKNRKRSLSRDSEDDSRSKNKKDKVKKSKKRDRSSSSNSSSSSSSSESSSSDSSPRKSKKSSKNKFKKKKHSKK